MSPYRSRPAATPPAPICPLCGDDLDDLCPVAWRHPLDWPGLALTMLLTMVFGGVIFGWLGA